MSGLQTEMSEEFDDKSLSEELDEFKSFEQIKFEHLINRLSQACLVCSVILFIGQIVSVSASYQPDTSSVITGFTISLLLFLIWLAINKIYRDNSGGNLNSNGPLQLKFRIRNLEEIRLIIPKKWLCVFSVVYFLTSFLMISCETYLLSHGITSYFSDLGMNMARHSGLTG